MIENYESEAAYINALSDRSGLPQGFRTAAVPLKFIPGEKPRGGELNMTLSAVLLDEPTDAFAGVFTSNRFPGCPVIVGRERLSSEKIRGVLINNRIANVCSPSGIEDIDHLLNSLAETAGGSAEEYFSSSTGVIGWGLPVEEMVKSIPELLKKLDTGSCMELARGIMTTDSFPKIRSAKVEGGTIVAVTKGAGMIEPNMGTMLCFVMTDLDISRKDLREILPRAADGTFNRISVDGDQSTSDMILVFSSRKTSGVSKEVFSSRLEEVLGDLAEDIVRNGEGTSHVIKVSVSGAPDGRSADILARSVVNSPLVKTAVAGNDPNVGRIISSLGDAAGNGNIPLDTGRVQVSLGGTVVFRNGRFELDSEREEIMSAYLKKASLTPGLKGYPEHNRTVDIDIELGTGDGRARVLGSDLTHEYVSENADYRT